MIHRILNPICYAGLAILFATSACPAAATRPNVVVFLADDLGYGDPQCLNPKSKIPTPNIDRLSQQGMVFTDAHSASSVCTPSRYGLLTGRYCWRSKLPTGITWYWDPPLIDRDRLTMGKMFQEQGYATACVGKWHLGWDWPLKDGGYISDDFDGVLLPAAQRDKMGKKIDFSRPIKGGPTTRGFDNYFGTVVPNFPPYFFI
jgi:arylsulfatase A